MPWCASCGQFAAEGARFCPGCGARLDSGSSTPQLARKTVTVVFSDVSGFTALGEKLDPESVHEVMGRFFTEMAAVIERHGGVVEKFIGDELMALFGVPVVHEDDAVRAARAALEMRTRLEELNEELASRWDIRLTAHTGINTGEVVVGTLVSGEAVTYGDPVVVAQRLETAAAPGEILVGATTAELLHGHARLTSLAPLRLKGKSEPVQAWQLEDVGQGVRLIMSVPARRLVDRGPELQALREAWDDVAKSRRPRTVALTGPAGIGKSRLARALLDEVAGRATVVTGRCLPYGEAITYFPVAEIVRRLAARPDEAAIASAAGGGEEGERIASRVARAVGFSDGSVPLEETHWAVRRLLEVQAGHRPLVVAIDDLHWGAPTLLDLIEHLVTSTSDVPVLWLLLGRPELSERLAERSGSDAMGTPVPLGPLAADQASELISSLASDSLDPDEHALLLATAEGNPLFLEQLLASRAETGSTGPRPPATVQVLLAARIDALPRSEREVIDRAAVEGRDFHRGALLALLPEGSRYGLDGVLLALERRELIRPSDGDLPGEIGYSFAHVLVRDVAYELLPKANRASLHEGYANWLQRHSAGAPAELVGYHLEQAYRCQIELHPGTRARHSRIATRAAHFLGTAGRAAIDRGDLPAGVNLLDRAVALLPDDDPACAAMIPELGLALVQLGRLADAEDILSRAAARARTAGDAVAEAHAVTARFFARVQVASETAVAELKQRFDELRQVFTVAGDDLGLSRLWRARALEYWLSGESTEAEVAWMRAAARARRVGDEQGAAECMSWLASAACEGPTPVPEAIRRCESIVEQLQADRRAQALAMRPLATLHAMAGRVDEARSFLERANAILDDLGVGLTSSACHDDALVALLAGEPRLAEAALRAGYAALDEMGERALLATTAAMLARALYLLGKLDEALSFADIAQSTAPEDDLSAQITARTARAQVLAQRGDIGAAAKLSAQAVAIASKTDWLNDRADAMLVHAEVLRSCGDQSGADTARSTAMDLYERKGNVLAAERARLLTETI
jgi:class 3 adenylate cyclase/tetratricopeptide (TPR) repeat protein